MTVSIIVAMNNTYSIGDNGKLMFRIKSDLQRFKYITSNKVLIMGRKTFAEISKPLPNRRNIVLSRDESYSPDGVEVVSYFSDILEQYANSTEELFVIGGEEIFRQALPYTSKVYLTKVNDNTYGDTMFPFPYVERNFEVVNSESHNEDGYEFEFIDYVRKVDVNG